METKVAYDVPFGPGYGSAVGATAGHYVSLGIRRESTFMCGFNVARQWWSVAEIDRYGRIVAVEVIR